MNITGIQFYLKSTALAWLQANTSDSITDGDSFTLDVIDLPYRCTVEAAAEIIITRIFSRNELGIYDPELSDITMISTPDGSCRTMSSGRIEAAPEVMASEYLKAAQALKSVVAASGSLPKPEGLVSETEGILVKLLGNSLHFERVAGKKRPSLLCRSFFSGEQMMRPYPDEPMGFLTIEAKTLSKLMDEAELGDLEAMERIALAYLKGDDVLQTEKDIDAAFEWFSRLAEAGGATGAYYIALLCLQGNGIARDEQMALQWLEQAKALYSEEAYTHYDTFCDICQLRKPADDGDMYAAAVLAEAYMALGAALDEDEYLFALGIEAAKQAAEADIPDAFHTLALACEYGRGVPEDPDLAIVYYKRGAELGHPACCHCLGNLYLVGDRLISDADKGFALCMQAAEQDYAPAMQTVGICYQYGDGVESDIAVAMEWYEKYLEHTDDAAFAQQLNYIKSIPGLVDGSNPEQFFNYTPDPQPQMQEFSIFSDPDFSSMGGMDMGGMDMGGMSMGGMSMSGMSMGGMTLSPIDDDMGMDMGGSAFVSDSIAAMFVFNEAEEYELELLKQGILPDAPLPEQAQSLSAEVFPRIQLKAADGDDRAANILADIDHVTNMFF